MVAIEPEMNFCSRSRSCSFHRASAAAPAGMLLLRVGSALHPQEQASDAQPASRVDDAVLHVAREFTVRVAGGIGDGVEAAVAQVEDRREREHRQVDARFRDGLVHEASAAATPGSLQHDSTTSTPPAVVEADGVRRFRLGPPGSPATAGEADGVRRRDLLARLRL